MSGFVGRKQLAWGPLGGLIGAVLLANAGPALAAPGDSAGNPAVINKLPQDAPDAAMPAGPDAGPKLQAPMPMPIPQRPAAFAPKAEIAPPMLPSGPVPAPAAMRPMPGNPDAAGPAPSPKMAAPADNANRAMPAPSVSQAPPAPGVPAVAISAVRPQTPAPLAQPAPKSEAAALPAMAPKPAMPAVTPVQVDIVAQPAPASLAGLTDDQRAKESLTAEQRQGVQLHALQKEQPDYSIIVCEAGCGDAKPHIISKQLKTLIRSVGKESGPVDPPVTKKADCEGGCGYSSGSRQASAAAAAPKLLNDSAGAWMTTVAPSASAAPAEGQPQASKPSREDWMARINRQRADGKTPAADLATPSADPKT